MDWMKELEELSEEEEVGQWVYDPQYVRVAPPLGYKSIVKPTDRYRQSPRTNPSVFRKVSQTHQEEANDKNDNTASTFYGIRSIDVRSGSSQGDHETGDWHMKSMTSFDDGSNTSNIYHYDSSLKENNLSTAVLSDKARSIFQFKSFNKMQSKSFKTIYEENNNCVISSPTGSGKTVLFELAILSLLSCINDPNVMKILYIAPTKSLCFERERDWCSKFSSYGLTVGALTSDTSFLETEKVKKANIIITTPEKWDLMTRKWKDYSKLFKLIKLLLVDEIHILRDNRGSTLEVVITRMKKICDPLRIIALSATVPNIQDVSGWIKLKSHTELNAVTLVFGDDYRPVKLEKVVYGYKQTMNDFVFDSFLNSKLVEVLREHCDNKPVLIFCPTRNSTISTAKYLAKNYSLQVNKNHQHPIKEKELRELSLSGFSYHHAGLSLADRLSVEKNFIDGGTKVLCSTSTLAVGVNLPAYLVILKGTKTWSGAAFEEYSELDVLQMMGRAGRPQFETKGKAILMTDLLRQTHYEKLVKGNEKLESRLHLNLPENIVPEIYLKTIKSVESALEWLKLTFFYTRYRSNPSAYDEIPYISGGDYDSRLLRYTEGTLRELIDFRLIEVVDGSYQCTAFGVAMTKHYVLFDTMKMFVKCDRGLTVLDILNLVSRSSEFSNIRLKRTEKKLYKELNESPILKYPFRTKNKSSITLNEEKICLLVQYELGGLEYPNNPELFKLQQTFRQDKFFVFKYIGRIVRCLIDCFTEKQDFISLLSCLSLSRCLNGKCWEDSPMALRQLEGVGIAAVRRFSNQKIKSFEDVKNLSPEKIEYYLNQMPGFGSKVLKDVEGIPTLSIDTHIMSSKLKKDAIATTARVNITSKEGIKYWHGKPVTASVVIGLSTGELVDFRRAPLSKLNGTKSFTVDFRIHYKKSKLRSFISCEEIVDTFHGFDLDLSTILPQNQLDGLKEFSKDTPDDGKKLSLDDEEFDELLLKATNQIKRPSDAAVEIREKFSNHNMACKHACKDKTKCRHLCCREGIAPKVLKRAKTKEGQSDAGGISKNIQNADTSNKSTKTENTSFALLSKLHEKPNSTTNSTMKSILSKYKYYEPILDSKEKCKTSKNDSYNETDSSVDVIGLLRSSRNKRNQSTTLNEIDNSDIDGASESSVIMFDPSNKTNSIIPPQTNSNDNPIQKISYNEGFWSDEDLWEESSKVNHYDTKIVNDNLNQRIMEKCGTIANPSRDHHIMQKQLGLEHQVDEQEDEYQLEPASFDDLADLLGSDVEIV